MAHICITGSSDGLGQLSARALVEQGHDVVIHARNAERAQYAKEHVPQARGVLIGDLSDIAQINSVAEQANAYGQFDAVIHNAGVYRASPEAIGMVNVIAPYLLTCLIQKPRRLIYLSSGLHLQGQAAIEEFRRSGGRARYPDAKLYVVMLCMAVARHWKDVASYAVDPGWVPTKMGGRSAPDNLQQGYETQVWLATSNDVTLATSGSYFYHQSERRPNPQANDTTLQEQLLQVCADLTGVALPQDTPSSVR